MSYIEYVDENFILDTRDNRIIPKDTQNEYYRTYLSWKAEGGVPEVQQKPNVDPAITHKEICEQLLHEYIFKYYPIPTQNSIQTIAIDAQLAGRQDVIEECRKIWAWIRDCITLYRTHSADPSLGLPDFSTLPPDGLKRLSELEVMMHRKP
jgi:hypothetical protein